MGLDIYAYRVSKQVMNETGVCINDNTERVYYYLEQQSKYNLTRLALEGVSKIKSFKDDYPRFLERLSKYGRFKKYDFLLNEFRDIGNTKDLIEHLINAIRDEYPMYDCCFRKVNFIYEHYRSRMEGECCVASKEDIEELYSICSKVLAKRNEDYSKKHLPTTSGFFFGSTLYNDYYYEDVECVKKEMKKLYKSLKDDEFVLWSFSW